MDILFLQEQVLIPFSLQKFVFDLKLLKRCNLMAVMISVGRFLFWRLLRQVRKPLCPQMALGTLRLWTGHRACLKANKKFFELANFLN